MKEIDIHPQIESEILPKNVPVLILAGGEGTRIFPETHGLIPKALVEFTPGTTFLDQLLNGLNSQGFENYIFCLGVGSEQIIEHLKFKRNEIFKNSRFSVEDELTGTAGAIKQAIEKFAIKSPSLVITSDAIFPYESIPKMLQSFKKSSFVWAVTDVVFPETKEHLSILVDKAGSNMVGNTNSVWTNEHRVNSLINAGVAVETLFDGGHGVVDPDLFMSEYRIFSKLYPQQKKICIYKDLLPMMAEINRRNLLRGIEKDLLKVFDVKGTVLDMGTPERLALARELIHKEKPGL